MDRAVTRKNPLGLVLLAAAFLFCLFLAWATPYSDVDDMQWGLEQGLNWWLGGLLNGRYVGNFFAVVLCRWPWVKTALMGLIMFLIPLLMAWLSARGDRRRVPPLFLACLAGILLMPPIMWRETYGWVCGFGNYVVSVLFFLAWLLVLRQTADTRTHLGPRSAALFLLALASGLFLENLTVLFLGASLVLAVYAVWDKELRLPFWACLAGSALAAALMLGNGVLRELTGTGSALNGLRQLTFSLEDGPFGAACGILNWFAVRMLPIAFLRGVHMGLPMAVITACGFWHSRLRPLCVLGLFPLWVNLLIMGTEVYATPDRVAVSGLAWALPALALLARQEARQAKLRRLLLYSTAPLSLLFLSVTPLLCQRIYFFPMAVLVLSGADAASDLLTCRPGAAFAAALTAALMIFWGGRSGVVLSCTQLRSRLMEQAAETGADTLVLPTDRYGDMWNGRNPLNIEYADYFRQFYRIDDDVTLIFLPGGSFETWPEITPEQWEARAEFAPSKDYLPSLPG